MSRMYSYVLSLLLSSLRSGGSDLRRRAASLDQQEVRFSVDNFNSYVKDIQSLFFQKAVIFSRFG